jgi:hypothetical protein
MDGGLQIPEREGNLWARDVSSWQGMANMSFEDLMAAFAEKPGIEGLVRARAALRPRLFECMDRRLPCRQGGGMARKRLEKKD